MRKYIIYLFYFFIFSSGFIYGMDPTLEKCLRIAYSSDKKLFLAKEQIKLSDVRIIRSKRAFLPGISAQRRISRGKTTGAEEYQDENFGISVLQSIYEGGKNRASLKYDSYTLDVAKLNFTKVKEEVAYKVKIAYYELLSSMMEFHDLTSAYSKIKELNEKSKVEFKAKATSELELEEAQNFTDKVENMLKNSEANLSLATNRLLVLLNVSSLDEIIIPTAENLFRQPVDISFNLEECKKFVLINNVELKSYKYYIQMSEEKKKIDRSKVIPKLYFEGFYGQSGDAFVTEPLNLATVWNINGRLSWELWGNSFELKHSQEKVKPSELIDITQKIDTIAYDMKLSIFDDLNYFVESKESDVNYLQTQAEYQELLNKSMLELEKNYNEYEKSLRNAKTTKSEIELKAKKLEVLYKKNELVEVSTLEVMDGVLKYAETISSFSRSLLDNYSAISELEKLTLMNLR